MHIPEPITVLGNRNRIPSCSSWLGLPEVALCGAPSALGYLLSVLGAVANTAELLTSEKGKENPRERLGVGCGLRVGTLAATWQPLPQGAGSLFCPIPMALRSSGLVSCNSMQLSLSAPYLQLALLNLQFPYSHHVPLGHWW